MKRGGLSNSFGKIIAVDGYDQKSIHLVIESLQRNIREDLEVEVKTAEADCEVFPQFEAGLQRWDGLVAAISFMPQATLLSDEHWCSMCDIFTSCRSPVYILPVSPLMITLKAAESISPQVGNNHPNPDFKYLVERWRNSITPDITISIIKPTHGFMAESIFRQQGSQMNMTLTETGAADALSPRQLRRLAFEVEDWLHESSYTAIEIERAHCVCGEGPNQA